MALWIICEGAGGQYRSTTYELLSAARGLAASTGDEVVAVLAGEDVAGRDALDGLATRVVSVTGAALTPYSPDAWVEALAGILAEAKPQLVLFGEGRRTRELLPRLAVRLKADAFLNGVGLANEAGTFKITRPVMGGKAYASFACAGTCLAAFRPNSFMADAAPLAATSFEEVEVSAAASRVEVVERHEEGAKRVDITEAQVVVGGGRGMKVPDNLKLLEDLAAALGGVVGVTRALVDAGWATHAIQIGKSGKTISPALYFSCGISGAVHHIMGMDTSKCVVTVNTDRTAPMFEYSDYGIVADAMEVLPAVTEEIEKALA